MSSIIISGAVICGVLGGGSSLYGISKGNRALTKAFKKRMQYAQKNYNYNQALLDRQANSVNDQERQQLFSLSLNAYQNNSSVFAAQAQTGYQGRNAQKIGRTVRGTTAMRKTAVKDAYRVQKQNIKTQKENLYISFSNQVEAEREALSNSYTHGTQAFMQFVNQAAMGAAMGAAGGAAIGALGSASSVGVDAVSGAAVSAGSGATAGTGVVAGAGATAGASSLVMGTPTAVSTASTGAMAGSTSVSGATWAQRFNDILNQNSGLFWTLNSIGSMTQGAYNNRY